MRLCMHVLSVWARMRVRLWVRARVRAGVRAYACLICPIGLSNNDITIMKIMHRSVVVSLAASPYRRYMTRRTCECAPAQAEWLWGMGDFQSAVHLLITRWRYG